MEGEQHRRSQAAMEYLSTYGWAILIIAIVVGILFYLGLFTTNSSSSTRAAPGGCQVSRPDGPYTIQFIGLSGLCANELPRSVVSFSTPVSDWSWHCADDAACINFTDPFYGKTVCNLTISAWSMDLGMGGDGTTLSPIGSWAAPASGYPVSPIMGGVFYLDRGSGLGSSTSVGVEYNNSVIRYEARNTIVRNQVLVSGSFYGTWIQTAIVIANGVAYGYLNGDLVTPASPDIGCIETDNGIIGAWDRTFDGDISNLQIYSAALSTADIHSLYIEGVGGAPELPYIVGWWPLNGNADDFSGDKIAATSESVQYTEQWNTEGAST